MTRSKTTDRVLILLLALAAGATGAVAMILSRRRRHHRHHHAHLEHKADIRSWENEGGNLQPVKAA